MRLVVLTLLASCVFLQPLACQSVNEDDRPTRIWRAIKRELSGPHGREYFESSVKYALLPTLYGTLVSSTPADHPNTFLIAMTGSSYPEVTLKLKGRLDKPLPVGTPVKFDGVAMEFTADPFVLTFDVEIVSRAVVPADQPGRK